MTPTVSVVVMAHRKRESYIPGLLAALDRPAEVVWDRRNDRWDTGRRAWQAIDRSADFGLVIQDDAIVCRDLVAGVEQALQHVPEKTPLCLYCGRVRPLRDLVQQLIDQTTGQTSWLTMANLNWGPGIVLPTEFIDDMIAWGDTRPDVANYDKRISRWLGHQGILTYYPWPSLVDHRDLPSLVPGRTAVRRAHKFIGATASALAQRWDGEVVSIPALSRSTARYQPRLRPPPPVAAPRPRLKLGVPVKFASTKYPSLQVPAARVRFRDGIAVTRDPDSIAVLLLPQVRAMGVEPAEPAPAFLAGSDAKNGPGAADPPASVDPDPDPDPGAGADEPTDGEVPQGNAEEVLAWVAGDLERARQALDAEQARDKPRTTLAAKLERIAGAAPAVATTEGDA